MTFKTKYLNCRYNFCRTRPVAKILGFWGKNTFLWGKDFCFCHVQNKFFGVQQNFGRHKKNLGVTAPEFHTVSAGLGRTVAIVSSIVGLHVCAGELVILKIYF